MDIFFETRRLYVAPRKSVSFFASRRPPSALLRRAGRPDRTARALREEADIYQRCLLAFDHHRDLIQATTRRLIAAKGDQLDGALVVSSTALALEVETPLPALETAK
jgi:hypothetical protein